MKKLRNALCAALPILLILALACYFTLTPIGALRLGIMAAGYPVAAWRFTVLEQPYHMALEENQLGYSLENPPYEADTNSDLVNWVVTKHGPFYTARYYGWG